MGQEAWYEKVAKVAGCLTSLLVVFGSLILYILVNSRLPGWLRVLWGG